MNNKLVAGCLTLLLGLTLGLRLINAADEIHEGKVVSVGKDSITVHDRRDEDNDTFVVNAQTKITYNGKPGKLNEIQAGDQAKVIAVEMDSKLIAKEIQASSPQ